MRILLLCVLLGTNLFGAEVFKDHRQEGLKDLDGYFPFTVPGTNEEWIERRGMLRERVLAATGLLPMPVKAPLKAVRHGRKDLGDYWIEKVYFESFPGFFVTGSLYLPKEIHGKVPGVLCPHGHWENGRFMVESEGNAKEQIKIGAEEFMEAARSPLQARCVQLARMGCVVFHYDMLGNADSQQISLETAHKFAAQGAATPGGFYTAEAEGQLQSILGLQTWDSIRALDFVEGLPEVDPARIGVTGASGGGSQTFLLAAVDDRPAVVFPAVMVCTAMQGGCTCENASLLRIGTGNVEIAALFAPKPLGMTAANDWTKEMTTKGFPELQQLYKMQGAPDKVALTSLTQFYHNYNHPSRVAMEQWFARHLLHQETAPPERAFTFQTPEDQTVWDKEHPAPQGGPTAERAVLQEWRKASEAAFQKAKNASARGWKVVLGRTLESAGQVAFELTGEKKELPDHYEITGEVRNKSFQEVVPTKSYYPKQWKHQVVVQVGGGDGKLTAEQTKLLAAGWAVVVPELLLKDATTNRRVKNPREAPSFTYGYNDPLFAQRVHDVLSVLKMVQTHPDYQTERIALLAGPGGGKFAIAAGAMAGAALTACVAEAEGFRFADLHDPYATDFLPGAVKYGDLPALESMLKKRLSLQALIDMK